MQGCGAGEHAHVRGTYNGRLNPQYTLQKDYYAVILMNIVKNSKRKKKERITREKKRKKVTIKMVDTIYNT